LKVAGLDPHPTTFDGDYHSINPGRLSRPLSEKNLDIPAICGMHNVIGTRTALNRLYAGGKNIRGGSMMLMFGRLLPGLFGLIFLVGCTNASNQSAEHIKSGSQLIKPIDKMEERDKRLPMTEQKFKTKEVIVKFKPGTSKEVMEKIADHYNLEIIKIVSVPYLYLYKITGNESVQEIITALKKVDMIEYSEPNFIYELM
jgi:hypothetical protein